MPRFRTVAALAVLLALAMTTGAAAGPSVTKLASDVAKALKTAKRADATAKTALTVARSIPAGPRGPEGAAGPAGASGSNGARGADGQTGPQGVAGATGPAGPQGSQGPKGDTGETGSGAVAALGYAHVLADYTLDGARSSPNVSVSQGSGGSAAYCFDVTGGTVQSAVVTLDSSMFNASNVRAFASVPAAGACSGDVSVILADPGTGPTAGGFYVLFN